MRTYSILRPISGKILEDKAKKSGLEFSQKNRRPQEDYVRISKKYPIFIVADGVTLALDKNGNYPNPSGAGKLAEIFCKVIISEAEKKYKRFEEKDLKEIFKAGNRAAYLFNSSKGRKKQTINYWDFDFFAATTAFALIKENKAYWSSLCDSGIVLFDKNGNQIFQSPPCWIQRKKYVPSNWEKIDDAERTKMRHRFYRNKINKKGELIGYGVVTGEKEAEKYLNTGVLDLNKESLILAHTDGFYNYLKLNEFIKLFLGEKFNSKNIKSFIIAKEKESPTEYGLEKSLIAVNLK